MKFKAFPKWVTYVFALSTLGWAVMVVIDLVTKQESKLLFAAHIALAAVYLIATVVYLIQYGAAKRRREKYLAQEAKEAEEKLAAAQQEAQKNA